MKPITYAIRVTLHGGRVVFLRSRGLTGGGPIATYRTKEDAEADVTALCQHTTGIKYATVIERSHGRQWPDEQAVAKDGREKKRGSYPDVRSAGEHE